MAIFIKQPLGNSPSVQFVLKKNRPEKFPFYRNKQLNCISCSMDSKMFFCSEFPDIPEKAVRVTRIRTQAIAKCFAFYANAIKYFFQNILNDQQNFLHFSTLAVVVCECIYAFYSLNYNCEHTKMKIKSQLQRHFTECCIKSCRFLRLLWQRYFVT